MLLRSDPVGAKQQIARERDSTLALPCAHRIARGRLRGQPRKLQVHLQAVPLQVTLPKAAPHA